VTLNVEAKAKTLRPRPQCLEAKNKAKVKSSMPRPKARCRGQKF